MTQTDDIVHRSNRPLDYRQPRNPQSCARVIAHSLRTAEQESRISSAVLQPRQSRPMHQQPSRHRAPAATSHQYHPAGRSAHEHAPFTRQLARALAPTTTADFRPALWWPYIESAAPIIMGRASTRGVESAAEDVPHSTGVRDCRWSDTPLYRRADSDICAANIGMCFQLYEFPRQIIEFLQHARAPAPSHESGKSHPRSAVSNLLAFLLRCGIRPVLTLRCRASVKPGTQFVDVQLHAHAQYTSCDSL